MGALLSQSGKHPDVDEYISHRTTWQREIKALRKIFLAQGLDEALKWNKPTYQYNSHNLIVIQPFKDYVALLFCKGMLLKDPSKSLVKTGPNTRVGRQLRFSKLDEIKEQTKTIRNLAEQSKGIASEGKQAPKSKSKLSLPDDIAKELSKRPKLKKAFDALTPGRQRSYQFHFAGAKQSATRLRRLEVCVDKIMAGLGYNERVASAKKEPKMDRSKTSQPKLLSGDNPQIPKGDGIASIESYLDAIPGWKQDVAKRIHGLILDAAPKCDMAIRWNSPFYGTKKLGWFVSYHCFLKYIKVTFFAGHALKPPPPITSKDLKVRYLHVSLDEPLDEKQFKAWVKRAKSLEGWKT